VACIFFLRPGDHIFGYDYTRNGKPDHLVVYRPGSQVIWFIGQKPAGAFHCAHQQGGGLGW